MLDIAPLFTKRTTLSLLRKSDYAEVLDMFDTPQIFQYIPHMRDQPKWYYLNYLDQKIELADSQQGYYWVGRLIENDDFIGCINLTPIPNNEDRIQIGWQVRKHFWKQGYAQEMAQCVFVFGKEFFPNKPIFGVFDKENIASRRILEKLGFAHFEQNDNVLTYVSKKDAK